MTYINQRKCSNRICIVHNGKVFDVTDFSTKHPGGDQILRKYAGQDITGLMQNNHPSGDGHKHSNAAYRILHKYYIGEEDDVNSNEHFHANLEERDQPNGYERYTNEMEDDLVDWSKPLFHQVGFLGDKYFTWVHQPVDRKLRLFSSDLFEFFGSSRWWMVPIFWIPVSCLMLWLSYGFMSQRNDELFRYKFFNNEGISVDEKSLPFIFCSGVLLWSFLEYSIHRWVFHIKPPARFPTLIRLHFLFHGQHHKAPMDYTKLVFPQFPASFLTLNVFLIYCLILPFATALGLLSGSIFGYVAYDLTHYYLHHGTPTTNYFKSLKVYHMKHHFVNQNAGYGISSKLWDYPFNTLLEK